MSGSKQPASSVRVTLHRARGLRLQLWPGALEQLQQLLDQHSFWARGRKGRQLRRMLAGSEAVVSAWEGNRLVGFGRATSDGVFRAALWDIVVAETHQGQGLGRWLVETMLNTPAIRNVERVYLMTTNSAGFYVQLGFRIAENQKLMVKRSHWQQSAPKE